MPLRGVRCPVDNQVITCEECLACRTASTPRPKQGHWCEYGYEHLAAMFDQSGRKTAYVSATMLTGCQRRARLQAENDYYSEPKILFPAMRGSIGHKVIEAYPEPGCLYEHRFEVAIPGFAQRFTGQIDKINVVRKKITDQKTKEDGKLPSQPDDAHIAQLNMYRYLVYHGWPQAPFEQIFPNGDHWHFPLGVGAEIEIDQLELVYWSMSNIHTFSRDSATFDVPIWPFQQTFDYIHAGMTSYLGKNLPDIPFPLNPESHPLCTRWCPVRDHCITALGAQHWQNDE